MGSFPYCLSVSLLGPEPFIDRRKRQSAGNAVKGDGPVRHVQGRVVRVGPGLVEGDGEGIVAGRMLGN